MLSSLFRGRLMLAGLSALALGLAIATSAPGTRAQTKSDAKAEEQLTPEEKKEREARKGCKVEICGAFHLKKAGGDIACNVLKTWRKEQIEKMVSKGGLSWQWGNTRCVADIKLKRAALIQAVSQGDYELVLDQHVMSCEIERPGDAAHTIKLAFTPKVAFKGGKAVKASMNWGALEAPLLAKGALWTVTAADNSTNILGGTMVDDINDFIGKKCLDVKEEWQGK